MINLCAGAGTSVYDEIMHPIINTTEVETEWGTGFHTYTGWKSQEECVSPGLFPTSVPGPNKYFRRIASLHERYWDGTRNTLYNLPQMYWVSCPGVTVPTAPGWFHNYTWSVYNYENTTNCLFLNMGTPWLQTDPAHIPLRYRWYDRNYCHWIVPDSISGLYPYQVVDDDLPQCQSNQSYASDKAWGQWLLWDGNPLLPQLGASWLVYPYALLVLKNWDPTDIANWFTPRSAGSVERKFGIDFLFTEMYDDGNLTTEYDLQTYPRKQSLIDRDVQIYNGTFSDYRILDRRIYGNNNYTVVMVKGNRSYPVATLRRISQPYFSIGYRYDRINWSENTYVYNNAYFLEMGCEYYIDGYQF